MILIKIYDQTPVVLPANDALDLAKSLKRIAKAASDA